MPRDYGTESAEKCVPVTVNLPPVLRNLIEKRRKACGQTCSAYIRMVLFDYYGLLRNAPFPPEMIHGQETDDR